jgi:hypothetical protein
MSNPPPSDNKSGSAFEPTGQDQGEEHDRVAWIREQQYFSSWGWAG